MNITAYSVAETLVGLKEVKGAASNPAILAMLRLVASWPSGDDVPWCSAFVGTVAHLCGLQTSGSLSARSWLNVGTPIPLTEAVRGFDVVIFKRGSGSQPGSDVINAPGHVALFDRLDGEYVWALGGNQGDAVSVAKFPIASVLGVRRLKAA